MATPRLVTVRDFNTSRFAQLAETTDANISDILARAEAAIESSLRRPIAPTVFTEHFTPQSDIIYVSFRPIIEVTTVTRAYRRFGAQTPITSGYEVHAASGYIEFDIPVQGYNIEITYEAGFDPIPEDIKEAIMIKAALFAYADLEFYGSGDAKAPGILYLNDDIKELLEPYRITNMAYTPR